MLPRVFSGFGASRFLTRLNPPVPKTQGRHQVGVPCKLQNSGLCDFESFADLRLPSLVLPKVDGCILKRVLKIRVTGLVNLKARPLQELFHHIFRSCDSKATVWQFMGKPAASFLRDALIDQELYQIPVSSQKLQAFI